MVQCASETGFARLRVHLAEEAASVSSQELPAYRGEQLVPPAEPQSELAPAAVQVVGTRLVVATLNCGGALLKTKAILALPVEVGSHVFFLREFWEAFDPEAYQYLRYCLFCDGVLAQAAGLGILVLKDFLKNWSSDKDPQKNALDDLFIVTIFHPCGFRLILCELYLRPLQCSSVWWAPKECLQNLRPSLRKAAILVAGDLNQDMSKGAGRFASSLNRSGSLDLLIAPYALGSPMNTQGRRGVVSGREIDYVLIGINSPLMLETKVVLPRVFSQGAVGSSFLLPESLTYLTNVTGFSVYRVWTVLQEQCLLVPCSVPSLP